MTQPKKIIQSKLQEYSLGYTISKEMLDDDNVMRKMTEALIKSFDGMYKYSLYDFAFRNHDEECFYDPDEDDFEV